MGGERRGDARLVRGEEPAAELDALVGARQRRGPGPPAEPVARLQQRHRRPGRRQLARGRQARESAAEDDRVAVRAAHRRIVSGAVAPGGSHRVCSSSQPHEEAATEDLHERLRRDQPGDGRDAQDVPDDQRRRAARPRSAARTPRTATWSSSTTVEERAALIRRVAELHNEHRQRARRDHRPRDGQADRAGGRRGRVLRGDLRVLRRQRPEAARRRADRPARGRGLGVRAPQLVRPAARDHAVELPLLPGGPVRRPEPGDRQHDPAQARAAVPGVGRGDGGDLPRGRRSRRTRTSTSTRRTSRSSGSSATRASRACR